MPLADFTPSEALTLGVELELQLVTHARLRPRAARRGPAARLMEHTRRLGREARDDAQHDRDRHLDPARARIAARRAARSARPADARRRDASSTSRIVGGGTHAFQHWSEQQIYPEPRFHYISELYGYLSKQFTIFGQHVHVGCPDADTRAADCCTAVALHPALHRAVGLVALRAGQDTASIRRG